MENTLNKFEKKAAELNAWAEILSYANDQKKYCMNLRNNDDGSEKWEEPEPGSYNYKHFVGWCEVIKSIESMKI